MAQTDTETGFELKLTNDLGWSVEFHFVLDGRELSITPPHKGWPERWSYNNSLNTVSRDGVPPRHDSLTVSNLERVIRAVEGHIAYCYNRGFGPTNGGPMHFREEVWKWKPILERLLELWILTLTYLAKMFFSFGNRYIVGQANALRASTL